MIPNRFYCIFLSVYLKWSPNSTNKKTICKLVKSNFIGSADAWSYNCISVCTLLLLSIILNAIF